MKRGDIKRNPILGAVAAVSVGVYRGTPVLDLDYAEDSDCDTDMNVVMNDGGGFIELQGTAEGHAFRRDELDALLGLAEKGVRELLAAQQAALKRGGVVGPTDGSAAALLLARASNEEQRSRIGNQTGGRVAFFLNTDDFHRDHAAMLAAGVEFLEAPREEAYATVAVFRDLYGNTWDLLEPRQ
ncbi:hypothetical protein G6F68_013997 [Rhizopus microsporus]|nr:hypothetical protein G6F68_013997 [Rhizopus microsporus]